MTVSPSGLIRPDSDKPISDWTTIRLWVLDRDNHLCQICKIRDASEVDHIWPRRLGGDDHISNLRAACGPCNKAKGERVNVALATVNELLLATHTLGQRAEALEIERDDFERELLVRSLMNGDLAMGVLNYRMGLAARIGQLRERLVGLDVTLDRLGVREHVTPGASPQIMREDGE